MRIIRKIRTFLLVTAGFVLFRADSLTMAGELFQGMLRPSQYSEYETGIFHSGLERADFGALLLSLMILFGISVWREKYGDKPIIAGEGKRTVLCFAVLFVILLFGFYGRGYDMSAFIYSQF